MVKRKAKKAGIDKDVHPHTLRHSFATDLYRESKNLRLVQKALGHSSISTTEIYTHIVDEELEKEMKFFRSKLTSLRRSLTLGTDTGIEPNPVRISLSSG